LSNLIRDVHEPLHDFKFRYDTLELSSLSIEEVKVFEQLVFVCILCVGECIMLESMLQLANIAIDIILQGLDILKQLLTLNILAFLVLSIWFVT